MLRHPLVLTAALGALALAPSNALAGQVAVMGDTMSYDPAAGEVNDVHVTRESAHSLLLEDTKATVTVGAKCTSLDAHSARCENQGANGLRESIQLGDGDDAGRAAFTQAAFGAGLGATVLGGAGNDIVWGGTQKDNLNGGDGDDRIWDGDDNGNTNDLVGGAGDDEVDAADRADEDSVTPEREMAPTKDDISCGDGKDRVDVDTADTVPPNCEIVALLLTTHSKITGTPADDLLQGYTGDGDPDTIYGLAGNDRLIGQTGNDTLYGQDGDDRLEGDGQDPVYPKQTGGSDRISGGNGADHLIGGYGKDSLTGGKGKDRISGGADADTIKARDGTRDKIKCGSGKDRVSADKGDSVASDCEVVSKA
jgi:Ca2+-binding RTX toxin-like protein